MPIFIKLSTPSTLPLALGHNTFFSNIGHIPKLNPKFAPHFFAAMNLRPLTILFLATMFTASCSNEFDLTEGSVELPVVYGLISASDTATYVRVERAFVDEATSAYVLAKDPEKLYFPDIEVIIRQDRNGNKTDFKLTRVDGNLEGYKRSSGVFADAPNYLYKSKNSINPILPGSKYTLFIKKADGSTLTEATTTALSKYVNEDVISPGSTALLSFGYAGINKVQWIADPLAAIHDVNYIIYYKEEKDGVITNKSVTWHLLRNYEKTEYTYKGQAFYEFMSGAISVDPQVKRYMQNASLEIVSGGKEIRDYISIGQANLGITSSGEIPKYSNLSNGGLGLFSGRSVFRRDNIGFANITLDSLRNGIFTKSLNFK